MLYLILYLIMCLIVSKILIYKNLLISIGDLDFGDYFVIGFISIFWPIVIPIFLIGYIGSLKFNIKKFNNK